MAIKNSHLKRNLKKPDGFLSLSSRLLKYAIEQKTKIAAIIIGVMALVLLVSVMGYFSDKAQDRAFILLNKAMARYESIQKESGAEAACSAVKVDMQHIVDTYGRKAGGKFARFTLANICFTAGEYDQAIELYQISLDDFKGVPPIDTLAKSSLGYAYEVKGEHEQAATLFADISTDPGTIMDDEALFALGRLYAVLGKQDQRLEVSNQLMQQHPQSFYTGMVQERAAD